LKLKSTKLWILRRLCAQQSSPSQGSCEFAEHFDVHVDTQPSVTKIPNRIAPFAPLGPRTTSSVRRIRQRTQRMSFGWTTTTLHSRSAPLWKQNRTIIVYSNTWSTSTSKYSLGRSNFDTRPSVARGRSNCCRRWTTKQNGANKERMRELYQNSKNKGKKFKEERH
jgi:hypothetical protein